jgi:hypothetical protein
MEKASPQSIGLLELIRTQKSFDHLSRAKKLQLAVLATLVSLVCTAAWGAAAGSCVAWLALGNVIKIPLIILLSVVASAPLGVVAWKLFGEQAKAADLLLSQARSLLTGSLVLGTLVPIVALYYHSSASAGPVLAVATAVVALLLGGAMFVRLAWRAPGVENATLRIAIPTTVLLVQAAAILQLIALMTPILPDPTMFNRGIDGFTNTAAQWKSAP